MTIKFSDETIKHMTDRFLGWQLPKDFSPDAGISYKPGDPRHQGPSGTNLFDATQAEAMVRYMVDGMPSDAAAVFETAANGQVEPEPTFEVGKRYRTRGGDVVTLHRYDTGYVNAQKPPNPPFASSTGFPEISWRMDGTWHGAPEGAESKFDLLPGAIDDGPAQGEENSDLTDERIALELSNTFNDTPSETEVSDSYFSPLWLRTARRARELLLPEGAALAANQCHDGYGDEGGSHRCREVDTWKIRAERAEAAIERARKLILGTLGADPNMGGWNPDCSTDWHEGVNAFATDIAPRLGLTITPARELTVTWEGGK